MAPNRHSSARSFQRLQMISSSILVFGYTRVAFGGPEGPEPWCLTWQWERNVLGLMTPLPGEYPKTENGGLTWSPSALGSGLKTWSLGPGGPTLRALSWWAFERPSRPRLTMRENPESEDPESRCTRRSLRTHLTATGHELCGG